MPGKLLKNKIETKMKGLLDGFKTFLSKKAGQPAAEPTVIIPDQPVEPTAEPTDQPAEPTDQPAEPTDQPAEPVQPEIISDNSEIKTVIEAVQKFQLLNNDATLLDQVEVGLPAEEVERLAQAQSVIDVVKQVENLPSPLDKPSEALNLGADEADSESEVYEDDFELYDEDESKTHEDIKKIIVAVKDYDETEAKNSNKDTDKPINNEPLAEITKIIDAVEQFISSAPTPVDVPIDVPVSDNNDIPTVIKAVENLNPEVEPKDKTTDSLEIPKIIDAIEKYTSVAPNKPNDVPQIDVSLEMTKIIDAVENFLKQPSGPVPGPGPETETDQPPIITKKEPIETAIRYILENDIENFKKYVKPSKNINAQKNGITLLGYACLFLNLNAVNVLLTKVEIDKGAGNPGPLTILDEYIKSEYTREEAKKIKDVLFQNIDNDINSLIENIFKGTAKTNSLESTIIPLAINSELKNGLTILGIACLALNFEVANWLLDNGAKGDAGQKKPIDILREYLNDGQWSQDTIANINALIKKMEEQSKEVGTGFGQGTGPGPGFGQGTGTGTSQAAALTLSNKPSALVAQGLISKQAVINSDGSKIKQLESTITELKQQITDLTEKGPLASIVGATTGVIKNAKNNVGNALSGTPSRQNTIIDDGELDNTVKTIGTAKNLKSERTITYDTEKKLFSVGGIEVNPVKTTTTNQSTVQSVSQEKKEEACTKEECIQCSGTTVKGQQCKKNCMPNSKFCKSHTGQKDSGSTETVTSTSATESTSTPQYMTAFKTEEDDEFNKLEKRLGAILAQ